MENINFDKMYNILDEAFEPFLHRGYKRQKALLNNENYNIIYHKEDDNLLGFITYWDLDDIIFAEHFAVDKNKRGYGIGKKIFNEFLTLDKPKILEVEPPHTEIDKKRIKLYESFGFIFSPKEYYQPPYNKGDEKTRLHIMSSKNLSDEEFKLYTKKIHSIVYNV